MSPCSPKFLKILYQIKNNGTLKNVRKASIQNFTQLFNPARCQQWRICRVPIQWDTKIFQILRIFSQLQRS